MSREASQMAGRQVLWFLLYTHYPKLSCLDRCFQWTGIWITILLFSCFSWEKLRNQILKSNIFMLYPLKSIFLRVFLSLVFIRFKHVLRNESQILAVCDANSEILLSSQVIALYPILGSLLVLSSIILMGLVIINLFVSAILIAFGKERKACEVSNQTGKCSDASNTANLQSSPSWWEDPNHKIIFIATSCHFATLMNHNINNRYAAYIIWPLWKGWVVWPPRLRTTAVGEVHGWWKETPERVVTEHRQALWMNY